MNKIVTAVIVFCIFFTTIIIPGELLAEEVNILYILAHRYGLNNFLYKDNFDKYGWNITYAGVTGTINRCALGPVMHMDVLIPDFTYLTEYDAVVIGPATWQNNEPDPYGDLLSSQSALDLIAAAVDSGVVVYATCVGVRVLAAADVLDGVQVVARTGYNDEFLPEYIAAGAIFLGDDHAPVIDGNIVTTVKGQCYHNQNCEAIATAIENMQTARTAKGAKK